jgi:hypothetical protein
MPNGIFSDFGELEFFCTFYSTIILMMFCITYLALMPIICILPRPLNELSPLVKFRSTPLASVSPRDEQDRRGRNWKSVFSRPTTTSRRQRSWAHFASTFQRRRKKTQTGKRERDQFFSVKSKVFLLKHKLLTLTL